MKKKFAFVAVLLALLCVAPLCAAETKGNLDHNYGVGAKAGTVSGGEFQFRCNGFDVLLGADFGALSGGWVGASAAINFNVMNFDWTPGRWSWTIGAMGAMGYALDDDGFYLGFFAPFRLNYQFPQAPWMLYVELGPGIRVCPDPSFDMEGGIGFYWLFN